MTPASAALKAPALRRWIFLLMALAIVAVTAVTAWDNETGKASIDLSMNGSRIVYGLTTAISHYRFGSPLYSYYVPILEHFLISKTVTWQEVNALIASAQAMDPKELTPDKLHLGFGELDYDDKGVILWYLMSFKLFGPWFGSIYITYFLMLAASVMVYWLAFREDDAALMLLPLFALVHLALTTFVMAAKTDVMGSLLGTRPFAMLGVLPMLHLCLLMLRRRVLSGWLMAGVAAQVAYLLLVISIRSSAEVEIILLLAVAGLRFLYRAWRVWPLKGLRYPLFEGGFFRCSFVAVPLALFVGIAAVMAVYNTAIPREVREKELVGHLIWHNILGSFCLNKFLTNELFTYSKVYKNYDAPPPPDALAYSSTMGFYKVELHQDIAENEKARNMQEYERKARTVFFAMLQRHPKEILFLFTMDKRLALHQLMVVVVKQLHSYPVYAIAFLLGLVGGRAWLKGLKVIAPLIVLGYWICCIPAYVFVASTITMYDYAPYFYLGFLGVIATAGALLTWLGVRLALPTRARPLLRVALPVAGAFILPLSAAGLLLKERLPTQGDASRIIVLSATYGENVGAPAGNATDKLRHSCNDLKKCKYTVDVDVLGDPKGGASKDFVVNYECSHSLTPIKVYIAAEAHGSSTHLDCTAPGQ